MRLPAPVRCCAIWTCALAKGSCFSRCALAAVVCPIILFLALFFALTYPDIEELNALRRADCTVTGLNDVVFRNSATVNGDVVEYYNVFFDAWFITHRGTNETVRLHENCCCDQDECDEKAGRRLAKYLEGPVKCYYSAETLETGIARRDRSLNNTQLGMALVVGLVPGLILVVGVVLVSTYLCMEMRRGECRRGCCDPTAAVGPEDLEMGSAR